MSAIDVKAILTEEDFMAAFEQTKNNVGEILERDGNHHHIILVIGADGKVLPLLFDQIMGQAQETIEAAIKDGRAPKSLHVEKTAKDLTFKGIATIIQMSRAVGFFEIAEGWAMTVDAPDVTAENFGEKSQEYLQKRGAEFVRDLPERFEVLMISARWHDKAYFVQWKIGRRDDQVWLQDFHQSNVDNNDDNTRQSEMHQAVLRNIGHVKDKGTKG